MEEHSVRVRIAPSPTGDPHVGTAYVGLFNLVHARKHGGQLVLRIEDTDQKRSSARSEHAIIECLRWVGITWDEGPDVGGPYGPYRQSERLAIYREHVDMLLQRGAAYRCFCSPERLEQMRAEQRRARLPIRYDGRCRELAPEQVRAALRAGEPHVVRLRAPRQGDTVVHDVLRGAITYPNAQIDDQVLLKSDGFPTYHLASVVDDHLMRITDVIRAEEWIASTPKHLLLYAAFGWTPPRFVHLPLLRNPDRSKISKRRNPVSLEFYRRAGFLPEALRNFLALMGWSIAADREKFTLDEMIAAFSWDRMSLTGPVFDMRKLEWLNGLYIRELSAEALRTRIREEILSDARLDAIVPLLHERMRRLDAFVDGASFFLSADVPLSHALLVPRGKDRVATRRVLAELADRLDALPAWTTEAIEQALRTAAAEIEGWSKRELFMLVRKVTTGRTASPPLFESMAVIGKAFCQHRFRQAIALLRQDPPRT